MSYSAQVQEWCRGGGQVSNGRLFRDVSWRSRPLCCKYLFAEFKTVRLPVCNGDAVKHVPLRWALGLFMRDQFEVLGVWPDQIAPTQIAQDLHERGVGLVRAIAGDGGMDCAPQYRDAVTWPMVGESSGASLTIAAPALRSQRNSALQRASAKAAALQRSITRAIQRRAPFDDEVAATDFLALILEHADCQLQAAQGSAGGRSSLVLQSYHYEWRLTSL